jgi:GNAT superfamily N-acetyltransferase
MSEAIEDLSDARLLAALDANMTSFWLPYGRATRSRFATDQSAYWFYTGVPHPLFNGVMSVRLKPEAVKPLVETFRTLIQEGGAPALWWVGPLSRPDDLGARLEALGLQPAGEAPAMAMELVRLPQAASPIPGFTVKPVENIEARALWARIAAQGSGFSPAAADRMEALEQTLADAGYRAQRRYLGFLAGTPVAVSALVMEAGVAGIYAVATVPEARNRGIGRLMTLVPLMDARAAGYRVGVLQASSMGRPIYEKIGCTTVGTYRLYLQGV